MRDELNCMPSVSLEKHARIAAELFQSYFHHQPKWIVAAPGRVNLIGEHIDYNDGYVLPMAIERYCVIAAAEYEEEKAIFLSAATNEEVAISVASPERHSTPDHWSNYLAGVIAGFKHRSLNPKGFQAIISSNVPIGAGLSSSAALEVATATLIETICGAALEPIDKALLCQKAEHEFAGVPCGAMDQIASTMCRANHLMMLDCRSLQFEHIPFHDPTITVLIINTNVKRQLCGSEYAERRAQCVSAARQLGVASLRDVRFPQLRARQRFLEPLEYHRACHVVGEIARTVAAAEAVKNCHWAELGQLMYLSHQSLKNDFEVSCPELDLLVDLARDIGLTGGVLGTRMTGAGFGGCTVSIVETKKAFTIADQLCERYRAETGVEATPLITRAAQGAVVVHR